ncbi:hypothetical protein TNIN_96341 [Trichonephila inaurata madagascariensis]|uniref:Uncharacterized protein n=1 Tax=Trichonephila inaurata madagascariensis TaxID=2747483 RepID=A0A8X6YGD9_9ARAC|nr:hypothetical protein TNIN_96341 [Trichonephila inaurata madagascariensis]
MAVYQFCRLILGPKPSLVLLAACIKHHIMKYSEQYPKTVEFRKEKIYVDDYICSVDSGEETRSPYHEAKLILSDHP